MVMTKVTIGLDPQFVPLLDRLIAVLDDCTPVTQQQLLEFLAARLALRTVEHAQYVVDSMHLHIRQLIDQEAPRRAVDK